MGMRRIREQFAWYTAETGAVEIDLEDIHVLEEDDGSEPSSEESVHYAVYTLRWYNFPSQDGKVYVSDEIEYEDLDFGADIRVRFAELVGFSERELEEISVRLKEF